MIKAAGTDSWELRRQTETSEQASPVIFRHSIQKTADAPSNWKATLADAQKKRMELQKSLKLANAEAERLRGQANMDARRLEDVASENLLLTVRLKDQVEELQGKTKLLEVSGLSILDVF